MVEKTTHNLSVAERVLGIVLDTNWVMIAGWTGFRSILFDTLVMYMCDYVHWTF